MSTDQFMRTYNTTGLWKLENKLSCKAHKCLRNLLGKTPHDALLQSILNDSPPESDKSRRHPAAQEVC